MQMIDTTKINLSLNDDLEEYQEVIRNVKTILTTPKGTVAFDREFGIDWSILDQPMARAKGLLTAEYVKQVRKYEPRVKVTEVLFEKPNQDGVLIPKVVLESG
jgi:phage baseplate assembly protein W